MLALRYRRPSVGNAKEPAFLAALELGFDWNRWPAKKFAGHLFCLRAFLDNKITRTPNGLRPTNLPTLAG